MERKLGLLICSLAIIAGTITVQEEVSAVNTSEIYYENAELNYEIGTSGTVKSVNSYTLVNESDLKQIESVSRVIPSGTLENIKVKEIGGQPIRHEIIESTEDETTLKIYFDDGVGPGESISYSISYSDPTHLSQKGPAYKGSFGGVSLGLNAIPYQKLVVEVHGPPDSQLFTYSPTDVTELKNGIRYETQLSNSEDFSGIQGTWYASPVYYKTTLSEIFKNEAEEKTKNSKFDLFLFNKGSKQQKSALLNLPPEFKTVYSEKENNWRGLLKTSEIAPGTSKTAQIEIIQKVKVYDPSLKEDETGPVSEVPSSLDPYLKPLEYWQFDDPTLQEAVAEAVGDEKNSYRIAKKIIDFVTERLTYQVQTERIGAVNAYSYEVGDCSEYTDLSIALARAKGLPARASYGWGYQEGEAVGHAWPEFYFPGVGWEPADPTWADTGGQLGTGGLRPGPNPPGRSFGRFSPAVAGSTESYLSRIDSIHILRNKMGLESSESFGRYVYEGAEPLVLENKDVEILTEEEFAEKSIQAAKLNAGLASDLVEEGDGSNLSSDLSLANQYASMAENAESTDQIIELSWKSINHSDRIIRYESEKPDLRDDGDNLKDVPLKLVVTTVAMAWIGLIVWYLLKKR